MASSYNTQPSLLLRIRDPHDRGSWAEFVAIYAPLVYRFLRNSGLQDADAGDLTQDVLVRVAAAVGTFDYRTDGGSFRGWLFTIVRNRLRNFWRDRARQVPTSGDTAAHQALAAYPDESNGLARQWEQAHEQHLFHCAADRVRVRFREATWQAFWQTAVEGRPSAEVAAALGMSQPAVLMAKARVTARIRDEVRDIEGDPR